MLENIKEEDRPVSWEYKEIDKKGRNSIVLAKSKKIHSEIKDGGINLSIATTDTRPVHQRLFDGLTPKGCGYYAGNYRGSIKRLKYLDVVVGSAKTTAATDVLVAMTALSSKVQNDWRGLLGAAVEQGDNEDAFVQWLDTAIDRMVEFVAIHPYANGNGHISRFMMCCYLAGMNVFPENWPIDKRPEEPYMRAITCYRNGLKDELRELLLKYILGEI